MSSSVYYFKLGANGCCWGGHIGIEESVGDAAIRILKDRTGLEDPHLKFFSVFGDHDRKFTEEWKEFLEKLTIFLLLSLFFSIF